MNEPPSENEKPSKKRKNLVSRTKKPITSCNDLAFPVTGRPVPPELMVIIDFLAEKTASEHILGQPQKRRSPPHT